MALAATRSATDLTVDTSLATVETFGARPSSAASCSEKYRAAAQRQSGRKRVRGCGQVPAHPEEGIRCDNGHATPCVLSAASSN
jgi:hypothetical protein